MTNNKCKLSVIIATYNHANKICNMLDCLKNQSIKMEIIIVNDCSSDNTIEVVKTWQKDNHIPITLLSNKEKLYTLKSRLVGVQQASTDTIMFVDSDDILLGKNRLKRAYEAKKKHDCDILHFRSTLATQDGKDLGEALFAAPFSIDKENYDSVFSSYFNREYPPVVLWGKLFSRSLFEEVMPLALKENIFALDDKFLTSLLMFFAKSYKAHDEYIYHYYRREKFDADFYIRRLSALLVMHNVFKKICKERNIETIIQDKCLNFIQSRICITGGNLCKYVEKELTKDFYTNKAQEKVFANIFQYINKEDFSALLLYSCTKNVFNLQKKQEIDLHTAFTLGENFEKEQNIIHYIKHATCALRRFLASLRHVQKVNNENTYIDADIKHAKQIIHSNITLICLDLYKKDKVNLQLLETFYKQNEACTNDNEYMLAMLISNAINAETLQNIYNN